MRSSGVRKSCHNSGAASLSFIGIQPQIISEGDGVEAVAWVMGRAFGVLGGTGGTLRGRPRFAGEEIRVGVAGAGSTGGNARCSWIEYHISSVGKSPVISAN